MFGSSAQNLSTIYSDLDITIINNKISWSKLWNKWIKWSYDIEVIDAKVPIIKGVHYLTDIKFDISYNKINVYIDSLEKIKS